jgi:hypothetical protein
MVLGAANRRNRCVSLRSSFEHRFAAVCCSRRRFFYRFSRVDIAERGSFQNLIFSSLLQEVEMILEAALYLSFAAVVGIVKAYRRRQDVLYGPYISQNDRKK